MKQFLLRNLRRMSTSSLISNNKDNLASATYLFHPENVEIDIKSLKYNGIYFN